MTMAKTKAADPKTAGSKPSSTVHEWVPPTGAARDLGLRKLEESGLNAEDAARRGLRFLEPAETAKLGGGIKAAPSLFIPYHDPFAPAQPMRFMPKWPGFYRVRYLTAVLDRKGKIIRYTQPPNSGVCAYFDPTYDWGAVRDDLSAWLSITEGELKGMSGCELADAAVIGLGGVWN